MINYTVYENAVFANLDGAESQLTQVDISKKHNLTTEEFFEMLEGEFRYELGKENLGIINGTIEEINYEEV